MEAGGGDEAAAVAQLQADGGATRAVGEGAGVEAGMLHSELTAMGAQLQTVQEGVERIERTMAQLELRASAAQVERMEQLVAMAGGGAGSRGADGAVADAVVGGREVVTLYLEGDLSSFDATREAGLRACLAARLSDEMQLVGAEQVRLLKPTVSRKLAAQIGTGRCRVRVEIDDAGLPSYAADDEVPTGGEALDGHAEAQRAAAAEEALEAKVKELMGSVYWPKSVALADVSMRGSNSRQSVQRLLLITGRHPPSGCCIAAALLLHCSLTRCCCIAI
jgi:hypothetical protein